MSAKFLILILFFSTSTSFEYFVTRLNGSSVCVTDERVLWHSEIIPVFNRNGGERPSEVTETLWTSHWSLVNIDVGVWDTKYYNMTYSTVSTDGFGQSVSLPVEGNTVQMYALAVNATFLLTGVENWRESEGVAVYVDHFDEDSEELRTWAEHTTRLDTEWETGTILQSLEGNETEALQGGQSWVSLRFTYENSILSFFGNDKLVAKWKVTQSSQWQKNFMSVRTHQQQGLFRSIIWTHAIPKAGQKTTMSRFIQVDSRGRACAQILLTALGSIGRYLLVNKENTLQLRSGNIVSESYRAVVNESGFEPGTQLILNFSDLLQPIAYVGDCPGNKMEILKSDKGCSLFKGWKPKGTLTDAHHYSIDDVELTNHQLGDVCNALGFAAHNKRERVRYCGRAGCAYKNCP